MNHEKAVDYFKETAAYQRRLASVDPPDPYDRVRLEEATFCDAAAEMMTDRNAVLTRLQTVLLEAKSPEVDTPFADGFAAGLGVALKAVGKELEVDAAHISSLHKSVDGPLPEIESITTTENEEGVADGQ